MLVLVLALALLSGIPALVYEVVWTREVALLAGSQVEAISVVLAIYFGGLAAGSRWLGPLADRTRRPLALYGALEIGAGAGAFAAALGIVALRQRGLAAGTELLLLLLGGLLLLPTTLLLGGTLPALLRAVTGEPRASVRVAGWILGANTTGAVLGVATAALCVPRFGLRASFLAAGLASVTLGAVAMALARRGATSGSATAEPAEPRSARVSGPLLAAAATAGAATLAYESLVARAAALRLGSSLLAWALVLGLFLLGLALGNACFARRAAAARSPASILGWVQVAAALAIALGIAGLPPPVGFRPWGLSAGSLLLVLAAVLVPALLMGGAFPFFVRLGVKEGAVAGAFARISAANTAGGIGGALLAPFVLLPGLGLQAGAVACAAGNAVLGMAFLASGAADRARGAARVLAAVALTTAAALPALCPTPPADPRRHVLFFDHGRQASAAVVREGGARHLLVDGDPEASTTGHARRTEELLAVLPLLLHPQPTRLLEIGLGSGISLGTATRFPLERIDCVEIASSVMRAARFFRPDNRDVAGGSDPRVRIERGDGRIALARRRAAYDLIIANTVHPWSVGATGLYSQEYFERVRGALRPGGLAAQWLPVEQIGGAQLALLLRTFFSVFPEGGLWWGSESVIAVGGADFTDDGAASARRDGRFAIASELLEPLGIPGPERLLSRRIATADAVREALGPEPLLSDDRPRLELAGARRRARDAAAPGGELALLESIAAVGARQDPRAGPLWLWLQSRAAEAKNSTRARRLEQLAAEAGLALALESRAARETRAGYAALSEGRLSEAEEALQRALAASPEARNARFALSVVALERGDLAAAERELDGLLARHAGDAEAWNQLGIVRMRRQRAAQALEAFERALERDPYFPEALANAGLLALDAGDLEAARGRLAALRAISPLGESAQERALDEAIRAAAR